MKRALILLILLLTSCTSAVTPPPATPPAPTATRMPATALPEAGLPESTILDVAWGDRSVFRSGLIAGEQPVLGRLPGASVYHLDLQIADVPAHLEGRQEIRYTNQEQQPLDGIYFWLFPNLLGGSITVSELRVNGAGVEPVYELNRNVMRVPLAQPLQAGEQVVVGLNFSVEVPREAERNYGILAYLDGVAALAHFYPIAAVYDDEGWNLDVPPEYGDVVYADSSFYLVRVTAPADQVVVASGVEVERSASEGEQTVTYAIGPARDFYLALSERYTSVSQKIGETTVNSYTVAGYESRAEMALAYAVDSLESFNEHFGPFPYTEFDIVTTPTLALGIEYPGITAITLRLYNPDDEQISGLPDRVLLEPTVAHEVAHEWFYNTVGNDQVDEPWLDEALAQYATLLYYRDVQGPAGARGYHQSFESRWERVDRADIPIGMPVNDYSPQEYGAIVYGRGPLFFEALEDEIGRETLGAALRDYYHTEKWGIGTGDELKQTLEEHCDCDLTPLFREWVYAK